MSEYVFMHVAGLDKTSGVVSGRGAQLSRGAKRTANPSTADTHGRASQLSTKGRGKSTARVPLTCVAQSPEEENGMFISQCMCVCVCVCVCVCACVCVCVCVCVHTYVYI